MTLNKNQKIATIAFGILLVIVILFLTPCYKYIDSDEEIVGDLFIISINRIIYKKLFFEIGLLTVLYLLSLLVLKSKNDYSKP